MQHFNYHQNELVHVQAATSQPSKSAATCDTTTLKRSSNMFLLRHHNPQTLARTCSCCNITTLKVSSSCSYCNTTTPTLNFRLKQHNHHCLLVKVHDASPQLSHLQVHGITTTTVTGKCCNTTTLKSARTRLCNTLSFTVNQHRLIMQHHNHDC